ncbi:hypothetical protein pb186bvf_007734 [Paramecium bursaria]
MKAFIEECNKLYEETSLQVGQVTEQFNQQITQLDLEVQKFTKQIFLEEIPPQIIKLQSLNELPNQYEPLQKSLWSSIIDSKKTLKNHLDTYLLYTQQQFKLILQILTDQLQLLSGSKSQFTNIEILLKQIYFKPAKQIQQDIQKMNLNEQVIQQEIKLPHLEKQYDYIFSPADPSIQKILVYDNQIFTGGWDGQIIKQSQDGQIESAQIHESPIRHLISLQTNLLLALDDLNNIVLFNDALQVKTRYKLNAELQIVRLQEYYNIIQQQHILYIYLETGDLIKFNLINESDSQTLLNELKGTLLFGDRNSLVLTDRFWDDPGVIHLVKLDDQGFPVNKQKKKISENFIEKVVGNYFIDNLQQVYLNEEKQEFQANKIFQIEDFIIIIYEQDVTVRQGDKVWKFNTKIDEVYDVAYLNGLILVGVGAIQMKAYIFSNYYYPNQLS